MSDRPSAANGKRNDAWGTLETCPACGRCLCFGCHPEGPCLESGAGTGIPLTEGPWLATEPGGSRVAGMRARSSRP
jgi:hypothetical protein